MKVRNENKGYFSVEPLITFLKMKQNEEKMTEYNSGRIAALRVGFYNPGMAGPHENTEGYFLRSGVTEDTPANQLFVYPGNADQDFVRRQQELYTIKRD